MSIKATISIEEIIQQVNREDAEKLIKGLTDSIETEDFTRTMFLYFRDELAKYKNFWRS